MYDEYQLIYHPTGDISWHSKYQLYSFRSNGPSDISNTGHVYFSQLSSSSPCRSQGPSLVQPDGRIVYTNRYGRYHRTNGPAVIWPDGRKDYWADEQLLSADEFFLRYGVL